MFLVWVQNDYFQDDLFPPTKVLWEPTMTSSKWFGGANVPAKRLDLKPSDMETRKILGSKFYSGCELETLICISLIVSSLKAQSTTPSATTAPPIAEPIVSSTNGVGGFLSAVSARKEREKGAQVIMRPENPCK